MKKIVQTKYRNPRKTDLTGKRPIPSEKAVFQNILTNFSAAH